ncbi:lysoplasmalogenase [Streptomyces sp. FIT100]|uniref:lysoplasmalogenase n=1 Tax=Streptomyces sp. FIT100 TaxID=2837956 RepID=UPI0021C8D694|nr:lysoplasmalogenase [Streptomyces sp. FIT100]UUN26139.1 lysoplasmalogenase [Streptomyces sp. FIT100]
MSAARGPARLLLVLFAAAVLLDLGALLAGWRTGHMVAKPLLMPLLAAYAVTRGAPRPLIAALLCGWAGDVLLMTGADWAFLAGMGAFAAGHVCYLVLFGRRRPGRALGIAYATVLAASLALLWADLPAGLRIPVAGYSLLLTAVAYRSSVLGRTAGAGGALFLLSDMLLATGLAEWRQPALPDFWIMLTYVAAQYLLTTGALDAQGRAAAEGRAYRESRTAV